SGLPVFLYVLAKYYHTENMDSLVPLIRPSGGKFTPHMRRQVEKAFGAKVREHFGTAELGTVAYDCPQSLQQHLLSELFYVEFVRDGQCVKPGELGELVITDLRNHVAPLIRYTVGDVGYYTDTPCDCRFQGRRFTVVGTVGETVVSPDGRAFASDE